MRIIIIGAGQVGSFLARELSNDHDVVVIENDKERSIKIRDTLDVLSLHGEGDNPSILMEAGLDKSDILLAVSGDDRTNILSSLLASSMNLKNVVCRIRNRNYREYPELLKDENICIVSPSEIISEKLSILISAPFAWKAETFADGKAELFKLRVEEGTEIVNKQLQDIGPASSWIFVGVSRAGNIQIPSGNTVLKAGDYVYALGDPAVLKRLKKLFNLKLDRIHSAIIVGGGRLGRRVATTLLGLDISVKIIENDPERAELVAEELPAVTVFKGDATDAECLKEAGVESTDYLAALTGDDENNAFSALLAKNLGVKQTTVLYANPDYIDVLEAIGVDRAISVRLAIANEV
ncbi:MAG: Trk system potassium transporter TrkA, partial [Thermodesulfobacteriota bacterium]